MKFSYMIEYYSFSLLQMFFFFNQQIESRTLTIAHNLSQQLQSTCLVLVSSLKGLPQNIQVQAVSVSHSAMEIYSSFSKAAAIGDLSSSVLTTSRSQLSRIRDSMDNVMDYLLNNTPLNWLVGPFYPRAERGTANGPECDKPRTLRVTEWRLFQWNFRILTICFYLTNTRTVTHSCQ